MKHLKQLSRKEMKMVTGGDEGSATYTVHCTAKGKAIPAQDCETATVQKICGTNISKATCDYVIIN